jgi:hypothetical protein
MFRRSSHARWSAPALLLGLILVTACEQDLRVEEPTPTTTTSEAATTAPAQAATTAAVATTAASREGGQAGDPGDYIELTLALAPPNSVEASRIDGEGSVHVSWRAPDSPEVLRDHYEALIDDLGLSVSSTLDPPCCFWGFSISNPSAAGSIQLMKDGDGSTVTVLASQAG